MKKISLWATMLAMLLICGLCVTSCSKDDEEKDGGGKNGGKNEQTFDLGKYIKAYFIRGERVGSNLIVEMALVNQTDRDITNFRVGIPSEYENYLIYDDLGNQYTGGNASIEFASATENSSKSTYSTRGWMTLTIPAKGTAYYFMTIHNFDPTNRARKITYDMICKSPEIPGDDYSTIYFHDFDITDYRIMENGIQTNDTALVYRLIDCQRVGSVLQIDFSVTNYSNIDMGNLTFISGTASDDLGNSYEYASLTNVAFGEGVYNREYKIRLKSGETAYGRLRIKNFDQTNKAKYVSIPLVCSSDTYTFSDDRARFLTIPVKDNRILHDGIQTPDLNLDIKMTGTEEDKDGNKIINLTIKNNTGETLEDFTVGYTGYVIDDISNRYDGLFMLHFSMNDSEFFTNGVKTTIQPGATVKTSIGLTGLNAKAKNVTFNLGVSCDNYEFADNLIHFITIPVQ